MALVKNATVRAGARGAVLASCVGVEKPGTLSTYRLQLNASFDFACATAVCSYLAELGVSDVYVSPISRAQRGSTHGYDVCAYDEISPELGGEEGFRAFSDTLREHGLRLLVDFVPNHMGIATGENAWWNDVLENGRASRFADYFDIDWEPAKAALHDRVLYPLLGALYGEVLERGEFVLEREGGSFCIRYLEHRLPVAPRSLRSLFERALVDATAGATPAADSGTNELESIITAMKNLPASSSIDEDLRQERAREKEIIKRRTAALLAEHREIAEAFDRVVSTLNGRKGDAASFDDLDALLREQNYRLAYWRVAGEQINYRRFFDVDQLVAVRMERPEVFDAAHAKILALVREQRIDGLRLDHTDGLYDPVAYFERLRAAGAEHLYVVAEKILERQEQLPRNWCVAGTTGYDALALGARIFCDGAAEGALTSLYRRLTLDPLPYARHVVEAKGTVLRASFRAEVNMLARELERIADSDRRSRDFTYDDLRRAILVTVAAFPVYRTYVRPDGSHGASDAEHVAVAIDAAIARSAPVDASVFELLRSVLLLRDLPADGPMRDARVHFALRFQQLTAPVMAKGAEDTAAYRYVRHVAANEVGCDPSRISASIEAFHEAATARLRDWPLSMVSSSTHDTKRGEDVRARLAVLTERPEAWAERVTGWMERTERYRRVVDEALAPSPSDAYLFFQTVVGAWPFAGVDLDRSDFVARLVGYMRKATREAKRETSWLRPNAAYEDATEAFVRGALSDPEIVDDVRRWADETAMCAASNALAQVALKIMGPGVPDTYQGCELWSFTLVDPDNRAPVDYDARRRLLRLVRGAAGEREALARRLLDRFEDGAVKLYVTHALLALRREDPELLLRGSYRAVDAGEHALAFVREAPGRSLACVVPRMTWTLTGGGRRWAVGAAWGERAISLPARRWRSVLTGHQQSWLGEAPLREVLDTFPIAVLRAP